MTEATVPSTVRKRWAVECQGPGGGRRVGRKSEPFPAGKFHPPPQQDGHGCTAGTSGSRAGGTSATVCAKHLTAVSLSLSRERCHRRLGVRHQGTCDEALLPSEHGNAAQQHPRHARAAGGAAGPVPRAQVAYLTGSAGLGPGDNAVTNTAL